MESLERCLMAMQPNHVSEPRHLSLSARSQAGLHLLHLMNGANPEGGWEAEYSIGRP